jgi:hypothetical protein
MSLIVFRRHNFKTLLQFRHLLVATAQALRRESELVDCQGVVRFRSAWSEVSGTTNRECKFHAHINPSECTACIADGDTPS